MTLYYTKNPFVRVIVYICRAVIVCFQYCTGLGGSSLYSGDITTICYHTVPRQDSRRMA